MEGWICSPLCPGRHGKKFWNLFSLSCFFDACVVVINVIVDDYLPVSKAVALTFDWNVECLRWILLRRRLPF